MTVRKSGMQAKMPAPMTGEIRMLLWDTQQALSRGDISVKEAQRITRACGIVNRHILNPKPTATCKQDSDGNWCVRLLDGTIVAKFGRDAKGLLTVLAV